MTRKLYDMKAWLCGQESQKLPFRREFQHLSRVLPCKLCLRPLVKSPADMTSSHLMNPIVTIYVGEERVKFHAHQDTLCQLQFFQAALLGRFKEAEEKVINMPEDDPSYISALIEFMYTGNYTYTYDPAGVQLYDGSAFPVGDLTEGMFHVGIYATASKYCCPGLVEIATKHFQVVVGELDCINALRLWKAAYSDGLQFPGLIKGFGQYSSREGLAAWVKELYEKHRDEMEKTISEFPILSSDLLRITTGDSY